MSEEKRNIYQRIQAVASRIGPIDATSRDRFGSEAVGIEDVENAIRSELAAEGIITRWSNISIEQVTEGKGTAWVRRDRVTVVNADDPTDLFTDEWVDIGSNPMAASSFVAKGYYKRLLHIVEESDETSGQATRAQAQPAQAKPQPNGTASKPQVSQPKEEVPQPIYDAWLSAFKQLSADRKAKGADLILEGCKALGIDTRGKGVNGLAPSDYEKLTAWATEQRTGMPF